MDHRSPFSKDIYEEWESLVFGLKDGAEREPPSEQVKGWTRLHARSYREGRWQVSGHDAGLVASLGVTIAFRQRRFADAAELATEYLRHPEAREDDVTWTTMSIRRGAAFLLVGRVEEGIELLRAVLSDGGRGRHNMIRADMLAALDDLGSGKAPDPLISEFVAELLKDWRGHKKNAREAMTRATYGDLMRLLEGTFTR